MKTTIKVLLSFVIFTFTVISASAEIKMISTVGQDNSKPGAGRFENPADVMHWLKTGDVPGFAKNAPYDNCSGDCQSMLSKKGAELALPEYWVLIGETNEVSKAFKNGTLTGAEMNAQVWAEFEKTLFFSEVNFQGHMIRNMATGWNTLTNEYTTQWIERHNVRTQRCLLSKQGNYVFIIAKDSCGQPYPIDEATMLIRGTATLVSASANNPNLGPGNAGNGVGNGSGASGNAETVTLTKADLEAILAAAKNNSGAPLIINFAGNNNGNNNGGQGGQGGSITGQSGLVSPLQPVTTPSPTTPGYTDPQGNTWTPMRQVSFNNPTATVPLTPTQQTSQQPNVVYTQAPCNGCGTSTYDKRIARAAEAAAVGTYVGPMVGVGFGKLLDHFFPTKGNSTNNYYAGNSTSGTLTAITGGNPADWRNGTGR